MSIPTKESTTEENHNYQVDTMAHTVGIFLCSTSPVLVQRAHRKKESWKKLHTGATGRNESKQII